jgi:hypothetical protein
MAKKTYPYAIIVTDPNFKKYYDDEIKALMKRCKLSPRTQTLTDPNLWLYAKDGLKELLSSQAKIDGDVNITHINTTEIGKDQANKLSESGVKYVFLWDDKIQDLYYAKDYISFSTGDLESFEMYALKYIDENKSTDSVLKKRNAKLKAAIKANKEIARLIEDQAQIMSRLFVDSLVGNSIFKYK